MIKFIITLICIITNNVLFSQDTNSIIFNSIKCIDIRFNIIDYELSLYNVAYLFETKNNDTIIINRKSNYQTTGFYYENNRKSIFKLCGFQKDSVYSLELKSINSENLIRHPLLYYSYVRIKKDKQTFNPNTFNNKKKIKIQSDILFQCESFVDMQNKIYSITNLFPIHTPPDYLLPEKIYPFYIIDSKGDYIVNKKWKGVNNFIRITMAENGTLEISYINIPKNTEP